MVQLDYDFQPHKRGDTFLGAEFEIMDGTGTGAAPLNLTGYEIRMHIRRSKRHPSPLVFEFSTAAGGITLTDPVNGVFEIDAQIIDIEGADYLYDIEFTNPSGVVGTWIGGTFPVEEVITYD